jgi:hypothetical protein
MSLPIKSKKFQDLKAKWYKKLADSGFEDAEQDENSLKQWHSHNFSGSGRARYDKNQFSSKETYFRLAGQFLHEHEFENKRDRTIWEHHTNGATISAIATVLKQRNFKKNNRSGVYVAVQKLAKEMLKKYESDAND